MTDCVIWMATRPRGNGYAYRETSENGRRSAVGVHRLAYETAYGPIPPGHQVHHLCGTPLCVNVEHLRLVTLAEHRRLDNRGVDNNGGGKLTEAAVLAIYADPRPHRVIGRDYNVSHAQVGYIKRGRQWTHVTGAQDRAEGQS